MNIAGPKGFERSYTLEGTPKEQLQQRMGPRRFFLPSLRFSTNRSRNGLITTKQLEH
jgi:hypothetical protein